MPAAEAPRLSVIIPVRNDAEVLGRLLAELDPPSHPTMEVLVVDGGSDDDPAKHAVHSRTRLIRTERGRGQQLAAGVAAARGTWLWLLHADSSAVAAPLDYLLALTGTSADAAHPAWGRFGVAFQPGNSALGLVAFMMNQRSRLTGICTGDQGVFVHRDLLARAGGVPPQSLMEDIELSRRLKRLARPLARAETLTSSSRRWHRRGIVRTVLGMWLYRLRYWFGADPEDLAREYYR
ncbi:MAG: TIGR04283 family arsenosugar biosynthesis glycosyltransferase [Pseudomonadales bacterium]